jgi:malonate-semialdehyde dehydrogenase (acetylating)/methylmalonate-semialdehyde dehydrogenase
MAILAEVPYKSARLELLIDGEWMKSGSEESLPVMNPATGKQISTVPFALKEEVNRAVLASQAAFEKWKEVPLSERVQYLFRMKNVLEAHLEDLARINTQNHGKTVTESRGDIRRTIDNVEAAISASFTLLKGDRLDQVSEGIDEETVKEPLGVFGVICPFNFPIMVPFWYLPYAVVLGCTVVVKPSEVTPLPMAYVAELLQNEVKLPPGVLSLVHGSKETVESLIAHPLVRGVTFVGSTNVGRYVYKLAGDYGKRAIVQAGAKNSILVMPDANLPFTVESCVSSFFGNSGQRCLAGANLMVTGDVRKELTERMMKRASSLKLGYGLDESTEMGPMVSKNAKARVASYIERGASDGADLVLDGRGVRVNDYAREEIFGPVAAIAQVSSLDEAIDIINANTNFGNAASIFTSSGRSAREFRRRVQAGNIGINVGVVAPMAYFPFGGMRDSFFGVLHGQIDSVDFFTDRKVVVSRW